MMFLALALGLLWAFGILMAVVLCVASRRIDEDLAADRRPATRRGRIADTSRFARATFG
jgi:hypothetical protein